MAKGYFGPGMGRPKKEFDREQFEELCHIQCTESEIAAVMKMSVDTLERRVQEEYGVTFAEIFSEKREGGKQSLRRAQWKTAIDGNNPIMQIFLGKNMLGQKDKHDHELTGPNSGPIQLDISALSPSDLSTLESILSKAAEKPLSST